GTTGQSCTYKEMFNFEHIDGTKVWSQLLRRLNWERRLSCRAWWCVPVVPATQEAEVGELLEPGKWRLQ
uniref:Uncharacterized protein n=1 Tax=Macaca fascicularis TaxID=9541 RepID=A0A7N9CSB1_MACFA